MKLFFILLQACLSLIILTGCLDNDVVTDPDPGPVSITVTDPVTGSVSSAENTNQSCNSSTEINQGVQPDISSIENLFGCVTFSHTSSDGENSFEDRVVFTADSEVELISGRRTVASTSGSSLVECAELGTLRPEDFVCIVSDAVSIEQYIFTMDSQFKGSGTHQLCDASEALCIGSDGMEARETPATVTVARDTTLAMPSRTMNGLSISDQEAHDFKLADTHQFGKLGSTSDVGENMQYQALVRELRARVHSVNR